jgi:hypothetical protein
MRWVGDQPAYIVPRDGEKPLALEARWLACSERARDFAAAYGGFWPGVLPHVVAEMFDQGIVDYHSVPRNLTPD